MDSHHHRGVNEQSSIDDTRRETLSYLAHSQQLLWRSGTDIPCEYSIVKITMFLQITHSAVNNCAYCAGVLGSIAHQATVYRVDDFRRRRDEYDGAGWDGVNLDGGDGNENGVVRDRKKLIEADSEIKSDWLELWVERMGTGEDKEKRKVGMNQAYVVPLECGISTMILPHILDSICRPHYLSWTFLTLRRPHCASAVS